MRSEPQRGIGLLAACVAIRNLPERVSESRFCPSILDAVEYAIDELRDRDDKTAVIVIGEDVGQEEVERSVAKRATGLAEAVGQPGLFLTLAAQDIVRDRLMNDVRFEDFGIISQEDLDRADRLFAVIHPDLHEPERPQRKIAGNCPRLHRSFVGRHRVVDELQDLILQRSLVTIIGPPGVGKTATSIHVARSFDDEYEDGVWWFPVDSSESFDSVLESISTTRGLLSLKGVRTVERIAEGLRHKRCIVILDGCEGKVDEVSAFCRQVLSKSTSLTLLVTSTRPLNIDEEFIYRLAPMSLPRSGESGEDALIMSEALALFYERATQAGESLPLDDKTVDLVSKICEQADGLPVAIELIAGSLRTSSLKKIAKQLTQDLGEILTRTDGLDQALELSYKPLSRENRLLLVRLALFRGEWNVEVVSQIWPEYSDLESLGALHKSLVDASWLSYDPDQDTYRMLHTTRSFCWSKSGDDSEGSIDRFCDGVSALASRLIADSQSSGGADAERQLMRQYSDLTFALELSLARRRQDCASEIVKTMVHVWLARNLLEDAERLSRAYLDSGVTGMDAARALVMIGIVHLRRRHLAEAAEVFQRCLQLAQEAKHSAAEASTLINLGMTMRDLGKLDEARAYYLKVLPLVRGADRPNQLCGALCNAADVELRSAESPKLSSEKKSERLNTARLLIEEASTVVEHATPMIKQSLWHLKANLAQAQGDSSLAETNLLKTISICVAHDLRHEADETTEALAEINLARGQAPSAAKLLGLTRQIRRESGKMSTEAEAERYGRLVSELYRQLDPDRAAKLMRYGEKLDLAEILSPTIYNL